MIQELRGLGLDSYEAKVYLALVKIGLSTSSVISKESAVPYGKIYPVLYSLATKGYVKVYDGKPKRFAPAEPRVILSKELDEKTKELGKLRKNLDSFIKALEKKERPQKFVEKIQVIVGKKNYLNLSVKLHKKVRGEWRTIHNLPIFKPHMDAYEEMVKRGVKTHVLTSQANKNRIQVWKDLGVELRYSRALDIKYTVIDATDVIIRMGDSDKTGYLSIWIQNPALAKILVKNFDKLWAQSKPL